MKQHYYSTLLLFISIFSLSAAPAQAQQLHLEHVKLTEAGNLLDMPGGYSIAHYITAATPGPVTVFRHLVLDSTLRVRHERVLRLGGRGAEQTLCGSNNRAALYQFRWRKPYDNDAESDSTIMAVIDTAGQVLSMRRQGTYELVAGPGLATRRLASDSLLLLSEPAGRGFRLRCLNLQQREQWQFTFKPHKHRGRLLQLTNDAAYAWLLTDDNMRSRRVVHTLYCLNLRTGAVVSTTPLDYQGERRVARTLLPAPDHSLLVAGCTYHHRRISRKHAGDLFVCRFAPDGTHQLDHLTPLGGSPGLPGLTSPRTYWQSMAFTPDGNVRLLGQNFASTSYAANLAMVVATRLITLGFVGISATTLRSRELVSFELNPQGALAGSQLVPLPGHNFYTYFGYVPGQVMASLADQAGMLPLRYLAADGQRAVVHTGTSLMLLDLQTHQLQLLRDHVAAGDVWRVRPDYVLLYRHTRQDPRHTLELERLPLVK